MLGTTSTTFIFATVHFAVLENGKSDVFEERNVQNLVLRIAVVIFKMLIVILLSATLEGETPG